MINKVYYCGWCKAETSPTYKLKDGKYLCLDCATKHYNHVEKKMENHIQTIRNGLNKKKQKLAKFKEEMCKHENAFDTGYGVGRVNMKSIWRCPDCGKILYKEFGGF
jgi:DNA-directed RNA polymerase subunit RPC12/RpoP